MLKKLPSFVAFHVQAAKHSMTLLLARPMATLMTLMVIAITLVFPTLFWVFTDNMSQLTGLWKQSSSISLYLQKGLTQAEQMQALQTVRGVQGVGQASFKSADQGLEELTSQEGMQDLMRYLPENPLPPLIEVVPDLSIHSDAELDVLLKNFKALPQVAQAKLDVAWIHRLHVVLGFITKLIKALMFLLAFAVVLLIGNALRLAIHSRQEEIQILKLVGATDPFILRPFLYSGVWYGLMGALIAVFLVKIFIVSLGLAFHQVALAYEMHYPIKFLSISKVFKLLIFSVILGWLGAWLFVKRQLLSIDPL